LQKVFHLKSLNKVQQIPHVYFHDFKKTKLQMKKMSLIALGAIFIMVLQNHRLAPTSFHQATQIIQFLDHAIFPILQNQPFPKMTLSESLK
jgi:hypothetical protein